MTLEQFKRKYMAEGARLGYRKALLERKMLNESKGIDASEIGEMVDVQAYDLSVLKKYVEGIAQKTDYNKIVYFTSEAVINWQGKAQYGYTCNIDTENKDLVIERVGIRSKNSRQSITLSFNLSHPNGRQANNENGGEIELDMMSGLSFGDVIRKINEVNKQYAV